MKIDLNLVGPLCRQRFQKLFGGKAFSSLPNPPVGFGKEFALPRRDHALFLESKNEHDLDQFIGFNEKKHAYTFDGKQLAYSVTKVVETFFARFDADAIAVKMIQGPNWPRPEYMVRLHHISYYFVISNFVRYFNLLIFVCGGILEIQRPSIHSPGSQGQLEGKLRTCSQQGHLDAF